MRRFIYVISWLLIFPMSVFSQTRQITGIVKDSKQNHIPYATIQQKGTSASAVADEKGQFTINVTGNNVTLIVSSTGFAPSDVSVGAGTFYDIQLQETGSLSEVGVTALGISKEKKALGYATQEVKSTDLNINRQPNLVNALQGKVAGVTVSSIGGGPGQGATIRIRGINSIDVTQSNDPLFVIDGIILDNSTSTAGSGSGYNVRAVGNRTSDMNPEDIETINVLKGGAATALYGLRGANGVVVITTKKGRGDGIRVNASSTYGFDKINKTPEIQRIYTAGILGVYTRSEERRVGKECRC